MEEYEIRVKQLKDIKFQSFFKFFLILTLLTGLFIGLYYLLFNILEIFSYKDLQFEVGQYRISASIAYIVLAVTITTILAILYFLHLNNEYKKFYLQIIFNECKLDEIYLLENKIKNDKESTNYISKLFTLKNVKYTKSYSDASSKYSLDIDRIKYKKNKKNHVGTIFFVNFDNEKKGFLQLSRNQNAPFNKYSGQTINKFGFNIKSKLHGYNMFSTYSSRSYFIEDKKFEKSFIELENFIHKRLNLVLDSDSLFIFIEDYKIYFVNGLFKPINNAIFDEKIQVIKKFHKLTFTMIEVLDELFETKL